MPERFSISRIWTDFMLDYAHFWWWLCGFPKYCRGVVPASRVLQRSRPNTQSVAEESSQHPSCSTRFRKHKMCLKNWTPQIFRLKCSHENQQFEARLCPSDFIFQEFGQIWCSIMLIFGGDCPALWAVFLQSACAKSSACHAENPAKLRLAPSD